MRVEKRSHKNRSSPPLGSGIKDNYTRGTVAEFLKVNIQAGSRLSVVSAYFTIYAYAELKQWLDRIEHMNFLFGEPTFINALDPSRTEKKAFIMGSDGLKLTNALQQKPIAKDCADWIRNKVSVKSVLRHEFLHGKMYHTSKNGVERAILGSSNFTLHGLGLSENNNIELNIVVDSDRDRADLKDWFDSLWNDDSLVKDVKPDVLQYLAQVY